MKQLVMVLVLLGCAKTPEQGNYTPLDSKNQPIIIIQDSIVCNSDLSTHPKQEAQAMPTQNTTTETGKNNYIFYCFAFAVGVTGLILLFNRLKDGKK